MSQHMTIDGDGCARSTERYGWSAGIIGALLRAVAIVGLLAAPAFPLSASEMQQESESVEERARALLRRYYLDVPTPITIRWSFSSRAQKPRLPAACEGIALEDCFGGDPDCTPSFGLERRPRECKHPDVPGQREQLRWHLDSLSLVDSANDWLVGQRVYFAIKDGAPDQAVEVAEACQGTPWWCLALTGYAKHQRTPGSGAAELAMAHRLASPTQPAWAPIRVPEAGDRGVACEWSDIAPLLADNALLAQYTGVGSCGDRSEFEERFWWLADPMWSVPGNLRLDEHLSRNVLARLRDETLRSVHERFWDDPDGDPNDPRFLVTHHTRDRQDALLQTGPWNSWRSIPFSHSNYGPGRLSYSAGGSLIGDTFRVQLTHRNIHERYRVGYTHGGYSFTPSPARFTDPAASTARDWELTWNEGHERMLTHETWYNLDHYQTAVLRRGDRLLVLMAAGLPVIVPSFDSVRGALAMGRPSDLRVEVVPGVVESSGTVRASIELEDDAWLASVELLGPGWRGRARHGALAPELREGFGVSSPLLVRERSDEGELPLLRALLRSTRVPEGSTLGVYFEVYGAEAGTNLDFTVRAEPVQIERSLLGRLSRALGLSSDKTLAAISWSEPAPSNSGHFERHIDFVLQGISRGEYRLQVEVVRADGVDVVGERTIHVGGE